MSPEPRAVTFTPLHTASPDTAGATSGYSTGYVAGWSAGSRAAVKDAEEQRRQIAAETAARAQRAAAASQEALTSLAHAAAAARQRTAPVIAEVDDGLVRAAVSIAETLLGAELRDDDASAQAALRRALDVQDDDIVRIRLHPEDLAHLNANLASLPFDLQVPKGIELAADTDLARGDAVSELTEGYLDARLTTAVARVREALEIDQ